MEIKYKNIPWFSYTISWVLLCFVDYVLPTEELNLKIEYQTVATEDIDFPKETFDVITACQCFWYFDHEKVMPKLRQILKKDGRLLLLYMAWLPFEDEIASESEKF